MSLFFIKSSSSSFKNSREEAGLVVSTEVLGNLLKKDSDGDGVFDWEEGLWNTNPYSKDTDGDGIDDKKEIERLKIESGLNEPAPDPSTLSQTDRFSQELFATVAALSQTGEIDQASVDQISESLKKQIQDNVVTKVFTNSNLNIINDSSIQAIKNYDQATTNLSQKHQSNKNPINILEEAVMENGEIDSSVLLELESVVKNLESLIGGLLTIKVPAEFANLHLNYINSLQRLAENLDIIMLSDNDAILALGAISKYEATNDTMEEAINNLNELLLEKLGELDS